MKNEINETEIKFPKPYLISSEEQIVLPKNSFLASENLPQVGPKFVWLLVSNASSLPGNGAKNLMNDFLTPL